MTLNIVKNECFMKMPVYREKPIQLVLLKFHLESNPLYSFSASSDLRDKEEKFTNCEDIAMNFLVPHVKLQSPIKVKRTHSLFF